MTIPRPKPWQLPAVACLVLGSALAAQNQPDLFRVGLTADERFQMYLRQRNWEQSLYLRNRLYPYTAVPRRAPAPFHLGYRPGLRQMFPHYQGLPTYPENVPGYGAYPGVQPTERRTGRVAPLRPAKPTTDMWPSWIGGGMGAKAARSSPSQAVLVQTSSRVWLLSPGEEAYVPLRYFDKFRFLETGSRVQVRSRGELSVYCHDASTIRSLGPLELAVARLNREVLDLRLTSVHQLWLRARERSVLLTLPDGTVLTATDVLLHIEGKGDRVLVFNNGPSVVSYQGPMSKGKLMAGRYIALWPQRGQADPLAAGLELMGDVATVEDENRLRVTGGTRGRVTFSGARFEVLHGETLVLTPLAANRFPQKGVGLEKK
ncbi:MAG: hypothetical protein ACYTGW_06170 [Planctomycetota bacterium]|jgi:hypothetical protein